MKINALTSLRIFFSSRNAHLPAQSNSKGFAGRSLSLAFNAVAFAATLSYSQTVFELDAHYGFGASELSLNSIPGFAVSIYPVKNFGISAGLEYSLRWETKESAQSGTSPITADSEGDSLIFKYDLQKYRERRTAKILQVPILLKYSGENYYTSAGVKIGIPQKPIVKASYQELTTEGYYPQYDLTLTAPQYQGFGAQNDSSFKTKISSKTLVMLALEGGVKMQVNENFNLLAGIFADYSFNKGFDRKVPPFIERVENSSGGAELKVSDRWNSWRPWTLGVQVKIAFRTSGADSQSELSNSNSEQAARQSDSSVAVQKNANHSISIGDSQSSPQAVVLAPPPAEGELITPPKPNITLPLDTNFSTPSLPPELKGEPQFVFYYPESRTSPTDSLHPKILSKIAAEMRANQNSKLHCVGYSEKLASESSAYEIALQRSVRIRYTLTNFYGIDQSRMFVHSQGSKIPKRSTDKLGESSRKVECYLIK